MRLLVVDDDTSVRMQISMALDDVEVIEGFRVADALIEALREPVDAVVLDRRFPDGDGLRAVRQLRTNSATAELPIVVITADDAPSERADAFAAGADEHLFKPFEPGKLLAIVNGLLAASVDERRVRRTLHRARMHVGREDGGQLDLLPPPEDPTDHKKKRRWRRAG